MRAAIPCPFADLRLIRYMPSVFQRWGVFHVGSKLAISGEAAG
jgi:hypothetical protein